MNLFFVTVQQGKRLIAKGVARHHAVQRALKKGTLVVVAGTTNAFVAKGILESLGEETRDFPFHRFFRGVTVPSKVSLGAEKFPGDVVIKKGKWVKGKTIFDVAEELEEGDLILKGANALYLPQRQAGVLIGHEKAGTMGVILQAVVGRRVGLLIPVGLEKRVYTDILTLSRQVNSTGSKGPRLLPAPGEVFTEIDAILTLTGAKAELVAAGGAFGAEGGVWLGVEGKREQIEAVENLLVQVE